MLVCHAKDRRHANAVKTTANVMPFPYFLVRGFGTDGQPLGLLQVMDERQNPEDKREEDLLSSPQVKRRRSAP